MKQISQLVKFFILLFFIGFGSQAFAQDSDFGLWSTVDLSKKLSNRLKLGFEEEYRLRNNLLTTDKFQTTLELSYKTCDYFSTGVSYTMINYYHPRNDEHEHNYWELRNRFNIFGEGEYEIDRFTITLRERLQSTYRVLDSLSTAGLNPKLHLRSKLNVSYNIKGLPLEPYAFIELFHLLNDEEPFQFEKYRIATGLKYDISKKLSVKAGYLYTAETDSEEGDKAHIVTIGLGYKF